MDVAPGWHVFDLGVRATWRKPCIARRHGRWCERRWKQHRQRRLGFGERRRFPRSTERLQLGRRNGVFAPIDRRTGPSARSPL